MIETGDEIVEQSAGRPELLLYDYFKHMTTLSLVTLGGILSISQTAGVVIPLTRLLPSLGFISLAGTLALVGMEAVIKAQFEGTGMKRAMRWSRLTVSGAFGLGIGAFLSIFTEVIGR